MVITDLDGTLLDHHSYDWSFARPALDALRRLSIPVILASSKTSAELVILREQLAIVENGAGLLSALAQGSDDVADYSRLRKALTVLPAHYRLHYEGFGDMTERQGCRAHRLAHRARQRQFSEPGIWHGNVLDKADFLALLKASVDGLVQRT